MKRTILVALFLLVLVSIPGCCRERFPESKRGRLISIVNIRGDLYESETFESIAVIGDQIYNTLSNEAPLRRISIKGGGYTKINGFDQTKAKLLEWKGKILVDEFNKVTVYDPDDGGVVTIKNNEAIEKDDPAVEMRCFPESISVISRQGDQIFFKVILNSYKRNFRGVIQRVYVFDGNPNKLTVLRDEQGKIYEGECTNPFNYKGAFYCDSGALRAERSGAEWVFRATKKVLPACKEIFTGSEGLACLIFHGNMDNYKGFQLLWIAFDNLKSTELFSEQTQRTYRHPLDAKPAKLLGINQTHVYLALPRGSGPPCHQLGSGRLFRVALPPAGGAPELLACIAPQLFSFTGKKSLEDPLVVVDVDRPKELLLLPNTPPSPGESF